MTIILLQGGFWLWRLLITNPTSRNAESVARSWFYLALIVAFVCAVLILGFKALRKQLESKGGEKIWKRQESWRLVILGLIPMFLSLAVCWGIEEDYYKVIQFPGLAIGAAIAVLPYLIFVGLLHILFGWRRELF